MDDDKWARANNLSYDDPTLRKDTTHERLARAEGRHHDQMAPDPQAKFKQLQALQQSCEQSIAMAVAEFLTVGTAFDAKLVDGSHNVVTLSRQGGLEVQLVVKCGNAHEVRDDLWDAIMDRMDMDVSTTQLANAAMERLGFPTPDGGWPK